MTTHSVREHWVDWAACLVLAFGPVSAGGKTAGDSPQNQLRLEAETERQQLRINRLKAKHCREETTEECRWLEDMDLSLKEVRGELDSPRGDAEGQSEIRFARRELKEVRRSLDSLETPETRIAE
jgi:hypothetical protein